MKPKILPILLTAGLCFSAAMTGCSVPATEIPESENTDTHNNIPIEPVDIIAAKKGETSDFCLVVSTSDNVNMIGASIRQINTFVEAATGSEWPLVKDTSGEIHNHEIVIGAVRHPDCAALTDTLEKNEYAVQSIYDAETDTAKLIVAYKGDFARIMALDLVLKEFLKEDAFVFPSDVNIRGSAVESDVITTHTTMPGLRDPFILRDETGVYYAYGTGWLCYINDSGSLNGEWKNLGVCVTDPEDAEADRWAPEVYAYNGAYYMFTTYRSSNTGHRGCAVFRSDVPQGPFTLHSEGHITPEDWDSIDGSLYVDREGKPWMVFVHEWTSTDDNVGRMCVAPMSDDLTGLIGEPIELFTAHDPAWAGGDITDGCFLYEREDGGLIMLWSNWDGFGYAIGTLTNTEGTLDGTWEHNELLLYSKKLTGTLDGGHGMLFTDEDGQMYLFCHSPNSATAERNTYPISIPVREMYGTLVWDVWKSE